MCENIPTFEVLSISQLLIVALSTRTKTHAAFELVPDPLDIFLSGWPSRHDQWTGSSLIIKPIETSLCATCWRQVSFVQIKPTNLSHTTSKNVIRSFETGLILEGVGMLNERSQYTIFAWGEQHATEIAYNSRSELWLLSISVRSARFGPCGH